MSRLNRDHSLSAHSVESHVDGNILLTGVFTASVLQLRGSKCACKQINPYIKLE